MLQVHDIRIQIQRLGPAIGAPQIEVRFAKCCLSCNDCPDPDLRLATGGPKMNGPALRERLRPWPCARHLRLAGGEPLLQPRQDLYHFIKDLYVASVYETLTVATSGSFSVDDFDKARREIEGLPVIGSKPRTQLRLSAACKLPSSGMAARMVQGVWPRLRPTDDIRLLCRDEEDWTAAVGFLYSISILPMRPVVFWQAGSKEVEGTLMRRLLDPNNVLAQKFDMRLV